jgi:hypothetical protein
MDTPQETTNLSDNQEQNGKNARKWFFPRQLRSRQYLLAVGLFTFAGVVGGYAYYALVGCKTGGCAITSSPVMSVIWGGLLGYLVPDYFFKKEA